LAFLHGIFRNDSPILDVGCRNPYEGLLRFLRGFGWKGQYVGIDLQFDDDALEKVESETNVTLVQVDLETLLEDGPGLPFPPTTEHPVKQFAVAFCVEVLEHIENAEALVAEMQRVAAQVFIIGPNAAFEGYYPEAPGHVRKLSKCEFEGWGFQVAGYKNFNGRPNANSTNPYAQDNGDPATSSEVWGIWLDEKAEYMCRPREQQEAAISTKTPMLEMMAVRSLLAKAGHKLVVEKMGGA